MIIDNLSEILCTIPETLTTSYSSAVSVSSIKYDHLVNCGVSETMDLRSQETHTDTVQVQLEELGGRVGPKQRPIRQPAKRRISVADLRETIRSTPSKILYV